MDRRQVLAFRAAGHNLGRRLGLRRMAAAVGVIGVRDVKGSAAVALHARLDRFTGDRLRQALDDLTIVQVASARGASLLVPADDIGVFTIGTLPADEQSLRSRLKPFLPDLDRSGLTATEAVARAVAVARDALAAGPLDIGGLSGALTRALPALSPMCRGRCRTHHIEQGLFDLVGESGVWRNQAIDGSVLYVPIDEHTSRADARAELVRRYLRCHGPSTPAQFADWCGISVQDAARSLADAKTTDLGKRTYVLTADLKRLESPPQPTGTRLLPPNDPYLLDRDRATLIPDRETQKRVWRSPPADGIVLHDGEPVASWRPTKSRTTLRLTVHPFGRLPASIRDDLEQEATAIAALRDCTSAEVVIEH